MADVIIKGMEMPNNCGVCRLVQHRVFANTMQCPITGDIVGYYDEGLHLNEHNCPLVPIPAGHGDLIDRDALRAENGLNAKCEHCPTNTYKCQYDMIHTKMDFCEMLDDATVIVPAEGGTDECSEN